MKYRISLLIYAGLLVMTVGKITFISPPEQLNNCFIKKSIHFNNSTKLLTDDVHSWCIQEFRWHLSRQMWHSISNETLNWIDELIRMIHNHRSKRQTQRIRLRQEYRMMSDAERNNYHRAIQLLKADTSVAPNRYDVLANIHQNLGDNIHHGAAFLGWHRIALIVYENALRQKIGTVALPFWDSRMDAELQNPAQSIIWSDRFAGNAFGQVVTGPFRYWMTPAGPLIRNLGQEGTLFSRRDLSVIFTRNRMEHITEPSALPPFDFEFRHGEIHKFIGGQMSPVELSAYDPMFYLHHAFVDYLWELFRHRQRQSGINPETDYPIIYGPPAHAPNSPMRFGNLLNIQGLSDSYTSSTGIYTYQNPPTCTYDQPHCRSNYVNCEARFMGPTCVSATIANARISAPVPFPQIPNRTMFPANFFTRKKRSIRTHSLKVHELKLNTAKGNVCQGTEQPREIQNLFELNGYIDTRLWVFLPVRVISKRSIHHRFNSYPLHKGKIVKKYDIYNPLQYPKLRRYILKNTIKFKHCKDEKNIVSRVIVSSNGLNYYGNYRDFAILDGRQPFASSIVYIAVKSPSSQQTEAMFSAHDACGNLCKAYCRFDNQMKPCAGVLRITNKSPKYYGSDYGEAVNLAWNTSKGFPVLRENAIPLQFVCN